jgi:hypothetical protein
MKTFYLKHFSILMLVMLVINSVAAIVTAAPAAVTTNYNADNSTFPNPERGFHNRYDIVPGGNTDFSRSTNTGNTLVHSYLRLDPYRTSNIPQSVLNQLTNSFNAARSQGMKVILRTSYNFGPYPNSEPDASEAWINTHLTQLRPVLAANADVIAFIEAGFIGAWGEWHTSTNGLDTNMAAKIRILNSILANVPSSRQVALRYPSDVRSTIAGGVSSARVGNHQDCFLASEPDDWGTWGRDPAYTVQQDKDYIASVGVNHPVGGETCNVSSPRANCATALNEMAWMHFSEINEDYEPGVIGVFKSQGCYETIKQKLGYRFRLLNATYPTSASSGSSFSLQASLTNDGWASPYNQRPVFAVLDGSGGTFTFPLSYDARNWKAGQLASINQSFTLPSMPAGTYRLSLWLPDNATNLRSDARYSIRMANTGTWDSSKGYNVLATNISIGGGGGGPTPTRTNTPTGPTPTRTNTPSSGVTSYEAEASGNTLAGGAVVAACGTCSGGNKVGYVGNNAGTLQYNGVSAATAGSYTLTMYYLNGDTAARNATISVNGGTGTNISFPVTGSWTTVGSVNTTISLNAGSNTIRFSNATGWAPDFDRITVNTSGAGPTPTRTNTPTGPTATPSGVVLLDNYDGVPAWFYGTTNDLGRWTGASSFVNGGTNGVVSGGALVLQYANNGWFGSDVLQDISSKTYLVFVIRGAAGGEQNAFHVILGGVEKTFAAFSGDTITTAYKTIRINMVTNGVNRSAPGQLQMNFWWGSNGTITIDEIRFE